MALEAETAASDLIRQVQQALGARSRAASFVPLLYGRNGPDGLDAVPAALLAQHAVDALEFIGEKPKDRHKIRVRRMSAPAGSPDASVVEILNDDMPFLVDSVLGELQARGLQVRLLLHPIFKTRRDQSGRLEAITGPGDEKWGDGHQESYIAIALRALPDAAARDLTDVISAILSEVRVVVADWAAMRERMGEVIANLEAAPLRVPSEVLSESVTFLHWLRRDNFTFLGLREFDLVGGVESGNLHPVEGRGLGVLRDPGVQVLRRGTELVAMTPETRRFFFEPSPLIITKANVISRVHRRAHMDYIGIKTYREDGTPKGEIRLVGLFTSQAYVHAPSQIPVLRQKVEKVLQASGYPPASHAGKALLNILGSFPRDELFQIDVEQLHEWTQGILDLEIRPRVRVFTRVDPFDRFVSVLVYAPRDRYATKVRERIGELLAETYNGRVAAFYPFFAEGPLVRVQFIVARFSGPTPKADTAELERKISEIARTWDDRLADAIASLGAHGQALQAKYGTAFPASYADTFAAERALQDIKRIERLGPDRPMAIDFYRTPDAPPHRVHAAVYRFGGPIPLSERVPVLENLGFSAIDERSYRLTPQFADGVREVTLHDMVIETCDGTPIDLKRHDTRLEACFLAVFRGDAENDGFNRLVIAAGADWRQAAAFRAYEGYLRQLGSPFGLRYLAETLNRHAGVTRDLGELFHVRFDPDRKFGASDRDAAEAPIRRRIEGALAGVPSLDEDRILRQFLNLIGSTIRTNFFQTDESGRPPIPIAYKLDSKSVEAAPQPRPFREIWVHAPRVEGVHLRFAPIARGGIRWSDRAQDFRTEVLGLVRAQLVKNAVIVPSGAKGGFLPKQLPRTGGRDEIQKEGIAAYRIFISALLDLTDNIKDGKIVPPPRVVCHDGDDAYLVVAADKGTATFSDIANELSLARDFWLGDAFASGGSAGYDHKKMAITARGAWECVKRHFREMDIDIQRQPFSTVGVGDMSGDVFGNGMLLSRQTRLVAAFDHRDIFIDPDPDPEVSLAERKRLFDLPRSSWQDYDKARLSKGGGVYPRASKSIALSEQARALLGIDAASVVPNDLMRAILKCKADLLWFGGIGTYVRSSVERDADIGDRANDPLRVNSAEIGAKVVGEGANLGMTQRARIEFAARGGRLNTDFIDNSAGVNTSDQEVNIKIALAPATRSGKLSPAARSTLLASMTEDVAAASLRNNYQQSLALSLAEQRRRVDLPDHQLLMRALEEGGLLDRALEALPSDAELQELSASGRGLSRPELAVLLSYAKIALQQDVLASLVPDESLLDSWLMDYFPSELRERFGGDIERHSLRREIVATSLTNAVLNRGGPAMAVRLADETRCTPADVALAFLATREVFDLPQLWQRIDALDGKAKGDAQLALYQAAQELVNEITRWFLRDGGVLIDFTGAITRHREGIAALRPALDDALPPGQKVVLAEEERRLATGGVPSELAADVARISVLRLAPPIARIAQEMDTGVPETARVFLGIGEHLRIADLTARARTIKTSDYYDRLAVAQALAQLSAAQAAFTRDALRSGSAAVLSGQGNRFVRVKASLDELAGEGALTLSRLLVAAGQLSELAAAAPAAPSASATTDREGGRSKSAASETPPARRPARRPRS